MRVVDNQGTIREMFIIKYKELVTEQRERNGRLDYVVKLEDGPITLLNSILVKNKR